MVAVLPSRVVAICSPPGVGAMTTVVGPIGSACIADSERDRSIDQVPEKSGRPCACVVGGRDTEARSDAERTIVISALLDGRSIAKRSARGERVPVVSGFSRTRDPPLG